MKKPVPKGFTLIEVLMYIALFTMLIGGSVVSAYQLLSSGSQGGQFIATQEEGTFITRKINWALTGASSASVNAAGDTLTVVRPDLGAQSPLVITAQGGDVTLGRGGLAGQTLISGEFKITSPVFAVLPPQNGRPTMVSASLVVGAQPFVLKKYLEQ